jgi:hypothetical protein
MRMVPIFELDPRLKNIDNELTEIAFQEFETNIDRSRRPALRPSSNR